MNNILKIILYSLFAGIPIIIGGLLSCILEINKIKLKDEINHWLIAFGGGVLFSAVTFALIPKAMSNISLFWLLIIFLCGTIAFMLIDILINKIGGSLAQFMSMLMDFIPEALALGASFAHNHKFGLLLAIFIGLQNLPEGYNAYLELIKIFTKKRTLILMFFLSFIGIIAALLGDLLLNDKPVIISAIMLFASGGIVYLIFQDIAPLSKKKNDWIPATGASIGFLIGMLGEKILS